MTDDDASPPVRRRVQRGEGEVTQWPRGLAGYVSSGPEDATPSPDEDRTGNRLRLASRLLAVLRSQGKNVEREVRELTFAEAAYSRGETPLAAKLVDRLLADLDGLLHDGTATPGPTDTT